jgi:cytidylate kinase
MDSTAVVITGAPGAGKSSVLERLATLLEIDGIAFGALESEQLGWGSPWLDETTCMAQLAAVMRLQREAGRSLFLIAATTETSRQLAAVHTAIAADHRISVLLEAAPEVVAARIEAREPDLWPGKQPLVTRARALATEMLSLEGIDLRVRTDSEDVTAAAAAVRGALSRRGDR